MKAILKPIFELLTDKYTLFDNVLYDYLIISVIGAIAFIVSWKMVGYLYENGIICGSGIGSFVHWFIRLAVFVVVFYVFSLIIGIINFVSLHWVSILIITISALGICFLKDYFEERI